MTRETCLKRQLLYASVQTYHPDPPLRVGGAARWTEDPVPVSPGPSHVAFLPVPEIDFALVGRFEQGIVVAFRGTLPPLDLSPDGKIVGADIQGFPVLRDWGNSLRARLETGVVIGEVAIPGAVHHGFADSLARLWPGVAAEVNRLRAGDAAPHLYFTGHSKGGAIANLAAVCARRTWGSAIVRAATFGAARAGDDEFAKAYHDLEIACHRYEVPQDLVPLVPPGGFVEGNLLALHHCPPVGTPHAVAGIFYPPPPPRGFAATVAGLFGARDDRPRLPDPIAAHLPYRGFGYGENVCEPGCTHDWH